MKFIKLLIFKNIYEPEKLKGIEPREEIEDEKREVIWFLAFENKRVKFNKKKNQLVTKIVINHTM